MIDVQVSIGENIDNEKVVVIEFGNEFEVLMSPDYVAEFISMLEKAKTLIPPTTH